MWTQYFSQFFTSFFKGLRRICLRAKVGNLVFIICSMPVGIDCVTDKSKVEWKLHFREWKTRSFVPNLLSTQHWKSHFRALQCQNFLGKHDHRPPPPCKGLAAQGCALRAPGRLRRPTFCFGRLKKSSWSPGRALLLLVQSSVKRAEKFNILVLACWVRVY